MHTIEPCNLPPIPNDLLDPKEKILSLQATQYDLVEVNDQLHNWLKTVFTEPFQANYARFNNSQPPHKDISGRLWGFNWVIDTGGKSVVTTVYEPIDNEIKVQQEIICEPNQWYRLPAGVWHSVHGIEPGRTRILLTVTLLKDYVLPVGRKIHPCATDKWWTIKNAKYLYQTQKLKTVL